MEIDIEGTHIDGTVFDFAFRKQFSNFHNTTENSILQMLLVIGANIEENRNMNVAKGKIFISINILTPEFSGKTTHLASGL